MNNGGRPAIPDEVKKLQGTFRKDRVQAEKVKFEVVEKITAPRDLTPEQKKIWKVLAKPLIAVGLLQVTDKLLLAALCREIDTYMMCCEQLKTPEDYVTISSKGSVMQHPYVFIRNQAMKNIQSIGQQFGLTPFARQKINSPTKMQANEQGVFELFLGG